MSLPAPPAEPLHILPPESGSLLWLLWLIPLTLFLLWLRTRRAKPRSQQPTYPRHQAAATDDNSRPRSEIERLQRKYLSLEAYREGCHALAELLRRKLEERTGLEVEEMTSNEIRQALSPSSRGDRIPDGRRAGRLMGELADFQFRRREPERDDFVLACEEARDILEPKP